MDSCSVLHIRLEEVRAVLRIRLTLDLAHARDTRTVCVLCGGGASTALSDRCGRRPHGTGTSHGCWLWETRAMVTEVGMWPSCS